MSQEKKWKGFERLVAAIHYAEKAGGVVTWNDMINGRQFDVTIRFNYGFYQYLTVIECKDYKDKVPIGEVEAFVTKSGDVKANKAIMVSSEGFQSGCETVAERHGIELLILSERYEEEKGIFELLIPALNIYDIKFVRSDNNERYYFPSEIGGKLIYLVKKTKIYSPEKEYTVQDIITRWQIARPTGLSNDPNSFKIDFPNNTFIIIPLEEERIPVKSLEFMARIIEAKKITKAAFDPFLEAQEKLYYVMKTTEGDIKRSIKAKYLELGLETEIREGCFYVDPHLNFKYYCEKIEGDDVHWILVESYQHGDLLPGAIN